MAMRFRYKLVPVAKEIPTLGGRWVRPRPLILVSLTGPGGTIAEEGLLDCGADDTVFPEAIAARVGISLLGSPQGEAASAAQIPVTVQYAEVTLRLMQGTERREWRSLVGFAPIKRPLLGFAGFLQYFTATFHGDREEVDLAVNRLYPGT